MPINPCLICGQQAKTCRNYCNKKYCCHKIKGICRCSLSIWYDSKCRCQKENVLLKDDFLKK